MEQLDYPDDQIWSERRLWFESLEAAAGRSGATAPSEQACALMIDLQAAYCAGAFSAVVVLAAAIVEAQDSNRRRRGAIAAPDVDPEERRWLQDLRNRLVHENAQRPALSIEDHWLRRGEWEDYARRAVVLAFAALYPSAGGQSQARLPQRRIR